MPSWGFDEEYSTVALLTPNFQVVDQFIASENMLHPLIDEDRGVSLERVDRDAPSDWERNWRSASSTAGFATPGFANSQQREYAAAGLSEYWQLVNKVFSPNQDQYQDLLTIEYSSLPSSTMATLQVFDLSGRLWKVLANNHLLGTEGFYLWDGVGEQGLEAPAGVYLLHIVQFDTSGKQQQHKIPFGLAR